MGWDAGVATNNEIHSRVSSTGKVCHRGQSSQGKFATGGRALREEKAPVGCSAGAALGFTPNRKNRHRQKEIGTDKRKLAQTIGISAQTKGNWHRQ